MKIEHIAFNVADPNAMAVWYETHLGLKVVRKQNEHPYTHFLADESGNVMIEFYNNPPDDVPDYASMNPLCLHVAFVSKDPDADKNRLIKAGAVYVEEVRPDELSHIIMLRDPWGFAIQLCKRSNPMLKDY